MPQRKTSAGGGIDQAGDCVGVRIGPVGSKETNRNHAVAPILVLPEATRRTSYFFNRLVREPRSQPVRGRSV